MPKEIDEDARIANILGECAPEQVMQSRMAWQKNKIMRTVIDEALKKLIEERRTQLETTSPDHLKSLQGEIAGIRAARGLCLRSEK